MTYGTIYKFFELGINIQSDLSKILQVFERKNKIIDKYKSSQIGAYKMRSNNRPKTAFSRVCKKKEDSIIEKLDSSCDPKNFEPKGSIFTTMNSKIHQEAALCYNNFFDLQVNNQEIKIKQDNIQRKSHKVNSKIDIIREKSENQNKTSK